MIYKQSGTQYVNYPLSAHTDRFDPCDERHAGRILQHEGEDFYRLCSLHNHLALEILSIIEGDVQIHTNLRTVEASAGDVLIFNPFEIHSVTTKKIHQRVSYYCVNFDPSILLSKGSAIMDGVVRDLSEGVLLFPTLIHRNEAVAQLLRTHVEEICRLYRKDDGSPTRYLSLMAELLAAVSLLCREGYLVRADKSTLSREALFSQKVVRFVSEHYAEPLSTERIAEHLHFNKSYFCRQFKQTFGESFGEYLNEFRIAVARNLSVHEYHTVSAIAAAVGYASYPVFAKHFHRILGISPTAFYHSR